MMNERISWYDVNSFWSSVEKHIENVDVVLDVGCGIVPMNFFRPALHIMLEPYKEYVDVLLQRHSEDKSVIVLAGGAQEMLPHFTDNSVDSIFLLDVIEHFEKEAGVELLRQAERIARQQVVIFTPLGFMPQHAEEGETDAWGLGGTAFQEHLSGWLPEDFGEAWTFHICETFHQYDFRQQPIPEPYGAMFAIRTFAEKPTLSPGKIVNIRRPLPSEIALAKAQTELAQANALHVQIQGELEQAQAELANTQAELSQARRVLNHPVVRLQRKAWQALDFWK